MLTKAIIAAAAACAAAVALAVPAQAQPGRPPCDLAVSFICNMIPSAPDLDHDVDLSTQLPVDPNAPNPETLPPLDPCSAGCI
ncbi:MAG: fibronectin-binding protein [Mycobacterium sp.]